MLHPRLEALFADFNQARVYWCLLRLPAGTGRTGGDIDLLVDRQQVDQARRILAGQDFIRLPGRKPGLHFLSYDRPTDVWLWIHLVSELSFGPYSLLKTGGEAACLERRQPNGRSFTLADEDAFWELLLHCLLDKGHISSHHQTRLQELAYKASGSGPLAQAVEAACPPDSSAGRIASLARDGSWAQLENLAPALTVTWQHRHRVGRWQILRRRIFLRLAQIENLPRSRGLSVALLGPDGAGKSTLLTGLQDTFMLPVYPVYMGLTGGYLPYANRLLLPFLVIPGRLVVLWTRYCRAWYHQARGQMVVFDRYIYDYVVPTPYPLSRLERVYRWIDGHSCPMPDLVLILDAPGQVMFQRKGEYDPLMLENWRQHFRALQSRLPQSELIDTTVPAPEVLANVTSRIWRRYVSRWSEE